MATILIVEDEYLVRVGLRTCIDWEKHGFTLLEDASDGICAYERIVSQRPDIILLDIKMPRLNGFELLEKLKSENIPVNAIILSCCDDFESVRTALHLGVIDYMNKLTLNPNDLLKILTKIKIMPSALSTFYQSELTANAHNATSPNKIFEKIINGDGTAADTSALYAEGYVGCVRFTPNNAENALSANICLNMVCQVLKNSGINSLACYNENGTVCLLLPVHVKNSLVSFALKNNLEHTLNAVCSIGFSSLYQDNAKVNEHYQLARQIEELEYFGRTGSIETFSSLISLTKEAVNKFDEIRINIKALIATQNQTAAIDAVSGFALEFSQKFVVLPKHFTQLSLSVLDLFREPILDTSYFKTQNAIIKAPNSAMVSKELCAFATLYFSNVSMHISAGYSPAIKKVFEYIIANYSRFVTLTEAAAYVNMSESYLSQLFKKETGETFTTYIHRYKIDLSKTMLNSNMLVYEVCDKIGFENPNYFSKIFKRFTGVSPNEYKRKEN